MSESKEGTVGSEGKCNERGRAVNSPKTPRATWDKIQIEYERGSMLSCTELAQRYGVHPKSLETRMRREKWRDNRDAMLRKAKEQVEKTTVKELTEQESYLKNAYSRAKKYEQLLDKSIEQVGEIVEPSDLDCYTRSELRIHELAKSSLRIAPVSIDITSGGKDLGTSFAQALQKLRADPNTPMLQDADLARVLEADVE